MTDNEWLAMITAERKVARDPVRMVTFQGKVWSSFSLPAVLADEHGVEYVVKSPAIGPQWARSIVTEQVVTSLGKSIDAPVASVALVNVPQELVDISPMIEHLGAGIRHGSQRIPNATEKLGFEYIDEINNRYRFAAIALLYGWMKAIDHQLIYSLSAPHDVHSVDHGHFLEGSIYWTSESLDSCRSTAAPDADVVSGCKLTHDEISYAATELLAVSEGDIAKAVTRPDDSWGVTDAERVSMAKYLMKRFSDLRAQYP